MDLGAVLRKRNGASAPQSIRFILNSAKLLHIAERYGTLEAGKKANFIVFEKDPSLDIHNTQTIRAVWKEGKKVCDGPLAARW